MPRGNHRFYSESKALLKDRILARLKERGPARPIELIEEGFVNSNSGDNRLLRITYMTALLREMVLAGMVDREVVNRRHVRYSAVAGTPKIREREKGLLKVAREVVRFEAEHWVTAEGAGAEEEFLGILKRLGEAVAEYDR